MAPMPSANRPETKRDLAYHAVMALNIEERYDLLFWMVDNSPSAILVALEGLHWSEELDGGAWNQGV